MAKDITWLKRSFTDVPAVALPKTGGGIALFTDVSNTTATASDVIAGKIFFASDGTEQTGAAPNIFVIIITKNQSGDIWEPDCTFAEAKAALDAGKNIAFKSSAVDEAVEGAYLTEDGEVFFSYVVLSPFSDAHNTGYYCHVYIWDGTGIRPDLEQTYYAPLNATATPEDVANGKVFYNESGYQVGTGAIGGGSAVVVTDEVDDHGGMVRTITAVDLSRDTVSASTLLKGVVAHDSHGNLIVGTYEP